jgi:hypothetical protein
LNINLSWDASSSWSTYPGFGNSTYDRYVNGSFNSSVAGNYPNNVTWNSGIDLVSGQSISFDFIAVFSGGLESDPLHKAWLCSNGSMIAQ